MPIENFRVFVGQDGKTDYKTTLENWSRNLNYLLGQRTLDGSNIASTTLTLGTDQIKDYMIDFGTGGSQVNAGDIPSASGGTVESRILAIESTITNLPSSNILYASTSIMAPLSTSIIGSTVLTVPLAKSSDLNATNSMVNNLRLSLINLGVLTT